MFKSMKINQASSAKALMKISLVVFAQCIVSSCMAADQKSEQSVKQKTNITAERKSLLSTTSPSTAAQAMSLEQQVEYAKADLLKRLAVQVDDLSLLKSDLVTWRSGAIGCPKTGENYTQALTPGVLIVFAVDSKHYRYHAKRFLTPFICNADAAESPIAHESDI